MHKYHPETRSSVAYSEPGVRVTYEEAGLLAIAQAMREQEDVIFLSTEIPEMLVSEFGETRVIQTPISEAAITGIATGAAASGLRPIVWWRNAGFGMVALDQVLNHAAKLRYMSGGQVSVPLVLRASVGGGLRMGAQHAQSPYAIFASTPGLKVVAPASVADAYDLLWSAILDDNPVVVLEGYRFRGSSGVLREDREEKSVPLGRGRIVRSGSDVTVVAISYMVSIASESARSLEASGISVEIVDPRSLVPLDVDLIKDSVSRTRRLLVIDEAPPTCSMGHTIGALIAQDPTIVPQLETPIRCINGLDAPLPFSPALEDDALPGIDRVTSAIRELVK